jgi:hypothetical protein
VPGSVRVTQGEELLRSYQPPDGFGKVFCSSCGAHLFSTNPADDEIYSVRLGAFDGDPGIRPEYRQFVAFAAIWEQIPDDGLPRHDHSAQ